MLLHSISRGAHVVRPPRNGSPELSQVRLGRPAATPEHHPHATARPPRGACPHQAAQSSSLSWKGDLGGL